MQPIFLLVGGPGVGKTTTARGLAATFPLAVHIPVDDLREMVVSGFASPAPDWPGTLRLQVSLARDTAMRMALAYAAAEFAVVIDDFWDPYDVAEYADLRRRRGVHGVVLYPSQDEAQRRNAGRDEHYTGTAIPHGYANLALVMDQLPAEGWLILDTTGMTVADVVAAIRGHADIVGSGGRVDDTRPDSDNDRGPRLSPS